MVSTQLLQQQLLPLGGMVALPSRVPGRGLIPRAGGGLRKQGSVFRSTALLEPVMHSQLPMELAKRAITAALDPPVLTSTTIIQGAPNGATVWFTTVCALSVALAALSYNLFSILSHFPLFSTASSPPKRRVLYGVDVTNSRFFQDERVLAAVEFAAAAHAGQTRKTGEPYVSHCLETALIVEHNLPPAAEEQDRYAYAVAAAVLHDVIDDTSVDISAIKAKFGSQVASMVGCVSKLSNMNQLLRRGKRKGWAEYGPQHFKSLRKMIVDMVFEEPLVILIKLADRLHNMRTVFVLKPEKQRAVAEETLEVWCTMAECLGWDGMKSEMEDLCFAVLHPKEYCTLRAQLDRIWSLPSLEVVVDQADSASLPANALAPAPPLTARSRRAAAATAARKAAAAAKAAMTALSAAQREQQEQPAAAVVAAQVPTPPIHPLFPWFARLMPPQNTLKPVPGVGHPTDSRTTFQPASSSRSKGGPEFTITGASVLSSDTDDLNLGIRIVSSAADTDGPDAMGMSDGNAPRWDMVSWSLDAASASVDDMPHEDRGGSQSQGVQASAHANVLVTDWQDSAPHKQPDVRQLTAASVARFVTTDAQELLLQQEAGHGNSQKALQGWQFNVPLGSLTEADRKLLQESLQMIAAAKQNESPSQGKAAMLSTGQSSDTGGVHATATSTSPAVTIHQRGALITAAMAATATATATLEPPSVAVVASSTATAAAGGGLGLATSPLKATAPAVSSTGTLPRPRPAIRSLLSADELEEALGGVQASKAVPAKQTSSTTSTQTLPTVLYTKQQLEMGLAALAGSNSNATSSGQQMPVLKEQQEKLRSLISTVVPFDSVNFKDTRTLSFSTRRGLEVLDHCAELLYNEVMLRSSGGGLSLQIQGRLKSLHSVYRKMVRKGCSVAEVYDARALRVIVGDDGGSRMRDAIDTCYKLVSAVHSIWKPIPFEFDDYIANPKPSGYQALHTAVKGPGGVPMEVQIKTSSMHELAEYGAAAHWVYKEYSSSSIPLPITSMPSMPAPGLMMQPLNNMSGSSSGSTAYAASAPARTVADSSNAPLTQQAAPALASTSSADQPASLVLPVRRKGRGWEGQPVLKVAKDKLRYGVVVATEQEGQRLLVAVRAGPTSHQYPIRVPDYGFYRAIMDYVQAKGWVVPGHSDFNVRLEEFVLANDGRFHRKDHMGYVQPGEVLTLLEGYEEDADAATRAAYHLSMSQTAARIDAASVTATLSGHRQLSDSAHQQRQPGHAGPAEAQLAADASSAATGEADRTLNVVDQAAMQQRRQMQQAYLRTQQLRTMIEWGRAAMGRYHQGGSEPGDEVSVLVWPGGTIEHWPRGTTVGQVVRAKGITTLAPLPEPPDIRPSATAIAGGDDGWLAMYSRQNATLEPPVPVVNVNNRLMPEDTVLNDGDLVILAREKVKI